MKLCEIQGQVTAKGYRNYVRTQFLMTLRDIDPRPLTELRESIFKVHWRGPDSSFKPLNKPKSNLEHEHGRLKAEMAAWKQRWNLVETSNHEPWINAWALKAFSFWEDSTPRTQHLMLPPVGCPESVDSPTPFIPPPYLSVDRITDTLFIPITKADYLTTLCRSLRSHMKKYFEEVEMVLQSDLRSFVEIEVRDLIWAVRWQVSQYTLSTLADDPERLFRSADDPLFFDPANVNRTSDIVYRHYNKSTVQRAVRKVLNEVGISPRN